MLDFYYRYFRRRLHNLEFCPIWDSIFFQSVVTIAK